MTEDGWEDDYTVYEEVPKKTEEPVKQEQHIFSYVKEQTALDERTSTLKINLDSVRVHIVEAVKFKAPDYLVRRHRWVKQDLGKNIDEAMLSIDL